MNETFPCKYCSNLCNLIYSTQSVTKWECTFGCLTVYRVREEGKLISTTWENIWIKGKRYVVKFYDGVTPNSPDFAVYCCHNNYKETPNWEEVLRWDFIPDWTPFDARDKLLKYLPFL